ncbi:hypothetical protein [Motiliproteus sp. SC1-56]|uniref:hypothetical protein n=1 Tax=Motiliproteus sp. SC1-56 TaxID=2799565 RepID=UPI001A901848|nr:hypothetical protein [Motiliproteus sp. SC1-56]
MSHLRQPVRLLQWTLRAWLIAGVALTVGGCSLNQKYSSSEHESLSLAPQDLEEHGIAFISPSMAIGNEEDRQTLALVFSSTLHEERPDIKYLSLPETLGAINRAGLAGDYRRMFDDYRHTGIFEMETLRKVGDVTDARYLVQLKLASFSQQTRGRYSMLGFKLFHTKNANIRLFFQVWDAENGTIAWEGVEELNLAMDTFNERDITFTTVVEETARNLIALLPKSEEVTAERDADDTEAVDPPRGASPVLANKAKEL